MIFIICREEQLARGRPFPTPRDSVKAEVANMALLRVRSRLTAALSGEKAWQDTALGEVLRILEHTGPPLAA